jgi:peptidyl-prolyl cis-trans isomerase C
MRAGLTCPDTMKSVNASHILVKNEKDAQSIMTRLEKGESFEDLAKRFSKCPSKSKGGNLGWFGKGDMVPEFETACFNAKKGDIVGPVKTEFGYHIIKINDQK